MADPKKLADRLAAEAMLGAAKDAARRALEDLTLGDEERAAREAERARAAKLRRWKWIAIGVAAVVVVLAIVALLAKLWLWILALAALGALAFVGYRFARAKLGPKVEAVQARAAARLEARRDAEQARAAAAEQEALREAEQAKERRIDDELAALKAKVSEPEGRK